MKVIRSINNNISHCLDSDNREVVVFGKGIGFYKENEEIPLSAINRTFYNIKDSDFGIIRDIPTVVINAAIYIIDKVSDELSVTYPSSKAISLADHLHFAMQRKNMDIYLKMPLLHEIRQLYPKEMRLAEESLKIIKEMTGESLPKPEAGTLALHFIADRLNSKKEDDKDFAELIRNCTMMVEKDFGISIDRESFNFSRFLTHFDYLLRRLKSDEKIESQNQKMYEEVRQNYPDSFRCAEKMREYLEKELGKKVSDEEILYLVIHINRLISRI